MEQKNQRRSIAPVLYEMEDTIDLLELLPFWITGS